MAAAARQTGYITVLLSAERPPTGRGRVLAVFEPAAAITQHLGDSACLLCALGLRCVRGASRSCWWILTSVRISLLVSTQFSSGKVWHSWLKAAMLSLNTGKLKSTFPKRIEDRGLFTVTFCD